MECYRFDYLKPKEIKLPEFKTPAEAVIFVLKLINEDKRAMQGVINAIVENQERSFHSLHYRILLVAKEVDIDIKKLEDETKKYMDDNWEKLKKFAADHNSIKTQLEDIFKEK